MFGRMYSYFVALILINTIEACGVTVHMSLIHRLEQSIPAHLTDHLDFVRGGAFYPDAFYNCAGLADAAEDAHWPPFLAAGSALVQEMKDKGEKTESLEAFLVGVLSHQVADVSWHSLGVEQGLLRVMADREFNQSYDDAHTVLDVGGDMIQMHRLLSSEQSIDWLTAPWSYDSNHIISILSRLGHNVSTSQIDYCMSLGRAALTAVKLVANAGYAIAARQSPILYDQLEDYFVGGMMDMHCQTEECLPGLVSWLNEGPPSEQLSWNLCQVFEGKRPKKGVHQFLNMEDVILWSNASFLSDMYSNTWEPEIFALSFKDVRRDISSYIDRIHVRRDDPTLRTVATGLRGHSCFGQASLWWNDTWVVSAPAESKVYILDGKFKKVGVIGEQAKYAGKFATRFGASLSTISFGNESYLAVGSPGLNRLYFYDTGLNWRGSLSWPGTTKYGSEGIKQVGHVLAADDLNGLLYVGAPYSDSKHQKQNGQVFVVEYSQIKTAIAANSNIDVSAATVVEGKTNFELVGSQISVTPKYVFIGAPGIDSVYGIDRSTGAIEMTLKGPKNTGFGGYVVTANERYIAIGSPLENDNGEQSGSVYVYKDNVCHKVTAGNSFTRFGQSGSIHNERLYVTSSHANNEHGRLWAIDLESLTVSLIGGGSVPYASDFGASISFNKSMALIGSPYFNDTGSVSVFPLSL